VLDDGHDSDLRKVCEQLIIFFLIGAAQNQIASEDKDTCCKDWQNFQCLKANNSVPKQEHLVNVYDADEGVQDPRESSSERLDSKLVHMEAKFRLVHLNQILEKLAQANDRIGRI